MPRPIAGLVAAALSTLASAATALAGGGPAETVVLVNTASAESRRVADHYVNARDVPAQQVCEVTCGAGLETSMDDFVRDVVDPLRAFLHARGLEDRCRFVVLTQGMPIVAHTPGGEVSTAAALSLLHTPVCGQPQTPQPRLRHEYTAGDVFTQTERVEGRLLLVTALISTTADEAMALVDRSVASDGTAPPGAHIVFQDANGAANVRDRTYDAERRQLDAMGFETEHAGVGADAVRKRKRVIAYMSGGSYSALSVDGAGSNEYLPGAICDMLQSFGAVPQNFTPGAAPAQFPVTNMVRAGITGVHGTVHEPYNVAFPDSRLFRPYVEGFTLAETFHQRMPYVYWMNLTLGDPLCAPYAKRPAPSVETATAADGGVTLRVAATGAVRIDAYVDGVAAGSVDGASGTIRVAASRVPRAARHRVLVEATGPGASEPRGWKAVDVSWPDAAAADAPTPRIRCAKIVVLAPPAVRAGDVFALKATAADAAGNAVPGWRGRFELRSSSPPVRWGVEDATSPTVELPSRMTKAGDYELRFTAPDDGCETAVRVHVDPAAFHHATTPADRFPLGQEGDVEVVLEDRFGNRVKDYTGTIALEVPADPLATLPPPVVVTPAAGGRAVLRGVLLTHAGGTKLVFRDAAGAVVSQEGEGVLVAHAAIRPWLVAGPLPLKTLLLAADSTAAATGEGSVVAKAKFERRPTDADAVALPPGDAKGGDAAVLVTWIEATAATKARLLGAAPGRLRIWLDGKEVFEGAAKSSDVRKREALADLQLAPGTHRLAVAAETKAAASASFEIDDGNGQFPAALRIRAHAPPKK